ncbi:Hsp20/alpha crystallin family protein [Tumebacillus algifaecis]|nr:Hsp20/alpha crystallin family protein [Tumebacillus algifaecis]
MKKNARSFSRWESHARQFFGNDFWEDILSVIPDGEEAAEVPLQSEQQAAHPARQRPAVDVYRLEGKLIVHVELPGLVNTDGIDLYVQNGELVVSGQLPRRFRREQTLLSERSTGEFRRTIALSEKVVEDGVQARYLNGLLEITLPIVQQRHEEPKKRISIQRDPRN